MNVALPALILFALLLPGFVFRSRLKRAERTSLDFSPFGLVVTEGVLTAMVLHLLWLGAAALCTSYRVDTEVLLRLASSDAASQALASREIARSDHLIGFYFASLLAFSYLGPTVIRLAVTKWKLDRAGSPLSPFLRFHDAPWYYLLTGADFEPGEEPDLISVSAIVDMGSGSTLYTGFLEDFIVTPEGQLDRLILSAVTRRPLRTSAATAARFIDGDYFVLRYEEAITLNIRYISLPDATATTSTAQSAQGSLSLS
ncbi:hypothetical protein JI739_07730 [Ramlibacter sp. AW1]|uniref:Uncharacterized protein n=1 Tax=Ramlibacter aurantiacus TaxID=2801330 RepID=A0A937D2Z8_9BURK|nr:hypothetical protein [Ramlibacter aurantiacus]MBL0420230.1 hypothetical protein [Ramlibacter aurantiacus]